ncbi:hypothetical protein GH714_027737 [Hevea brasiliensis]|uniref:Protein kinase domain-containing protein n=1 Tax=Hevea brasiliensis TaxID=3981 RepID=A0A6A6MGF8_HEVBR|nr:hypothetical protein GH714_027737 [Hevea brasiliensis]
MQSFLTFRSDPTYNTPVAIAYLLTASATRIASINNISSDVASIPTDTQVIIPVNCSCFSRQYYQHNATYNLKLPSETYFSVANNTYQGLSTCQAMMDQNPYGDRNLLVNMSLEVPLRCACPTSNQTALGFKYLLTYMVTWGDSISSIAQLFSVDQQTVLDANKLTSSSIIFPFTPILVPLTREPTKINRAVVPPPASPSPQTPIFPGGDPTLPSKSHEAKPVSTSEPKALQSESADYSAVPVQDSQSGSLSSLGIRYAIESLTLYKFEDLEMATGYFGENSRIKGLVYKGSFKGDAAAVKVMKGDVSREINILKKINHFNIIRLSGFCLHEGNTFLVYEFAENGALCDWLHSDDSLYRIPTLTWKQRVQIAYDVADALNYLHNYTNPPFIYKNLKTSNIFLDAGFRAKIGNFGLARTLENEDEGGLQLTRHVVGTQGYMAPEYVENGLITPKLDVFAFGVVILELLSGKEAAAGDKEMLSASISLVLEGDNVREKFLDFIDPSLGNEYPLDVAFSLANLAKNCVTRDINARPSIPQVIMTLSKILSSSLDWEPSLELQSSRSMSSGR